MSVDLFPFLVLTWSGTNKPDFTQLMNDFDVSGVTTPPTSNDEQIIRQITNFLQEIGIDVIETELDDNCFLPGLSLKATAVLVDRKRLKYPGDLLHEAGHIAVTEAELRPLIGSEQMPQEWPDGGNEMSTILWSYAAALHLQLPLDVVFHPNGYKGQSDWITEEFKKGNFIGIHLFEWMGFCDQKSETEKQQFPHLKKWLR